MTKDNDKPVSRQDALREVEALADRWSELAAENERESKRLSGLLVATELARDAAQYRQSADQLRRVLAKVGPALLSGGGDEVLVAIKRPDDYGDVHPDLVVADFVAVRGLNFEYRVLSMPTTPEASK